MIAETVSATQQDLEQQIRNIISMGCQCDIFDVLGSVLLASGLGEVADSADRPGALVKPSAMPLPGVKQRVFRHRKNIPTDDPKVVEAVRRARRIKRVEDLTPEEIEELKIPFAFGKFTQQNNLLAGIFYFPTVLYRLGTRVCSSLLHES